MSESQLTQGLAYVQTWGSEDVCAPKLAKMINKAGAQVYPTVDAIQVPRHSCFFTPLLQSMYKFVFHTLGDTYKTP